MGLVLIGLERLLTRFSVVFANCVCVCFCFPFSEVSHSKLMNDVIEVSLVSFMMSLILTYPLLSSYDDHHDVCRFSL